MEPKEFRDKPSFVIFVNLNKQWCNIFPGKNKSHDVHHHGFLVGNSYEIDNIYILLIGIASYFMRIPYG